MKKYAVLVLPALAAFLCCICAGCRNRPWPAIGPDAPDAEKQQVIEAMYAHYKKDFPAARAMTVAEYQKIRDDKDVVLVDTRTPEEFRVSRIPGAIPMSEYEKDRGKYRDDRIVLYCTIGYRSGVRAEKARRNGVNAYNLKGSILAWLHTGNPVVNENGETKKVHVYGEDWALAPSGYEMIY
jgi:rhodanese-related sulfurtransferase